ncbi:alpha/beta fold hydrolase [Haliscomenobacter hydrossis]|uniref:3-oxoadipate enol-lactonase n=1 Tax=Haliscomenobacter hydrossis (strain ATCC 27775 / DSM 1100 / LMG 10767 / O) TaxID=760192 RepID=F4KUR8_HALH1|nr:alpha/beta fold hydrolase [Haliscomenobacter hydrossis]AEE53471.1 3-oxoadipate enol-lactonase [Haliscomenobacter hydrossis DSM 1100]
MRSLGTNINTNVNGLMVSYNDEGPVGTPVVLFIHGFPLNKSMWNAQFEALKPTYRVIAYDVRGHGNSEAGTEDFSIELFVEDLLGFMDTLQLDQVILCGLSMGGYIALSAIEKHPERFIGLVLSDTQCLADTPEAIAKRMAAIESIREKGAELYVEQSIQNLFAVASFDTKPMEIGSVKEMMNKTTAQSMCNTLHALAVRKETCSKLSELTMPILILVGQEDKITPPKVARLMLDKTQHSTLVIVEHAGHLANIENPHQFNQQLMNFMDRYFPIDKH